MDQNIFEGARVLLTGATGSIGRQLVKQLATMNLEELRLVDNNETELFFLWEQYQSRANVQVQLGDIRDAEKMERLFHQVDIVLHTAALKHITLCERAPFDAVQTNIIGVQNIIRAALSKQVKRVLFTSSDKAVNPTNVMGTTKLMGERLMTAANSLKNANEVSIFGSTRFGNVAGSRGSVIPIFLKQIETGGPLTLTDPSMTRFVMTISQAANLVLKSAALMRGGEVFITKMKVLRIADLAQAMIDLIGPYYGFQPAKIKITEVGVRPGEKCYEELMTDEETRRSFEMEELYVTLPAFRNVYSEVNYTYPGLPITPVSQAYHSGLEQVMDKLEIREFLLEPDVLPQVLQKYIAEQPLKVEA